MKIEQIVMLAVLFFLVFGAVLKAMSMMRPDTLKRRIGQIGPASAAGGIPGNGGNAAPDDGKWAETIARVSSRVAKYSAPSEDWNTSPLRVRFMNAGLRSESASAMYFTAKTLLALALPLVAMLALSGSLHDMSRLYLLFALLGASAAGFYLPNGVLARLIERRQRKLFEDLPDAVDLMTVCVEAGLGFDAALARVTEEIGMKSKALRDELELVLLELRAGSGRDKALRNLSLRTGVEDIDTLATMLIQADRFGTSVGDSLRVYTDNLRTKRRLRAEEAAAKIAVKLLFPLIFFIFPALIFVLLGPCFIQASKTLMPAMSQMAQ
ncbi:type II secretion system F family protein [Paraburkholderia sp. DHOC27]|uniref:type II secretion system F family protein n=1 Tax=Paraburkholderia sp. DHOC27 TaxID=2303330 RepID=UPI000E3C842E|nr:type II secretion system F family protein [Paraburkholderia sp. DHOC27]RFU44615.1 type II secretion system F family protein [Paraburkholderia sp. DHOC27]